MYLAPLLLYVGFIQQLVSIPQCKIWLQRLFILICKKLCLPWVLSTAFTYSSIMSLQQSAETAGKWYCIWIVVHFTVILCSFSYQHQCLWRVKSHKIIILLSFKLVPHRFQTYPLIFWVYVCFRAVFLLNWVYTTISFFHSFVLSIHLWWPIESTRVAACCISNSTVYNWINNI